MATLLEGQEYGLASNDYLESKKSVIHFKLTDSCLKTLEDLFKKGHGASIQFQGQQGVIRVPASSGSRQPEQTFQLSLSANVQGDLTDCIQQTSDNGASSLQTLGSLQHKVAVSAKEDVYDKTRASMKLVEEETKKVCAKEIKTSSRHIGKVIKKKINPASLKVLPPTTKSTPVVKPVVSSLPSRLNTCQSTALTSNPAALTMSTQRQINRPTTPPGVIQRQPNRPPTPSSLNLSSQSQKPVPTSKPSNASSRVLNLSSTKPSSGVFNMPYRDRVIHLLALHSYKKPELMLRLQKDGIREKDKNSLGSVLNQVASVNKDNTFCLNSVGWAGVKQDWAFYSDQDKEILQKNLADRCITPTSPAVSPASSNPESPNSSQKRGTEDLEEIVVPSKKKRIAHTHPDRRRLDIKKTDESLQHSPTANRENVDEESCNFIQDFSRHFTAIENREQRSQYKQEFNREYSEYHKLHTEVDSVARRFQTLRDKIEQTTEGSPDFEVLKKKVLEEYEAQRCNLKFLDKKRRMEYLHQKLGHIKRLIHDFDHRGQVLSPAS